MVGSNSSRYLLALVCLTHLHLSAHAQSDNRGPRRNLQLQTESQAPFGSQDALRRPRGLAAASSEPPLALQGFCPVSLRDQQAWRDGDRRITAVLDGQTYRLAGEREYDLFTAAPLRYAPALGGDCPVVFAEKGQRSPGAIQYGLIHGGRAYFFASGAHREKFRNDPGRYADADLALGGNCPVRWVDNKRRVAGREDATLLVAGIRYRFAGLNEQQRFVAGVADYLVDGPQPSWALHGLDPGTAISGQPVNPFRAPQLTGSGRRSQQSAAATAGSSTREGLAAGASTSEVLDSAVAAIVEPLDGASSTPSYTDAEPMLKGFCPVSIITDPSWERGLEDVSEVYDGRLYLFASESKRDTFIADPYLYVPALRGACVVTYIKNGELVNGSVHQPRRCPNSGRLYLLAGEAEAAAFDAAAQDFLDLDLFHSGTCIVTLVEEGKPVIGDPKVGTWYHGLRYTFSTAEKRERFLAAPEEYLASAGDVLPAAALELLPNTEAAELE